MNWTDMEKSTVEKYLNSYLRLQKTPNEDACIQCKEKAGDLLIGRSWFDIRFFVYKVNSSKKREDYKVNAVC